MIALPNENDYHQIIHMPREPVYTYEPWTTSYVQNPLVKTLWSQSGYPSPYYNELVPYSCSKGKAPVGCVATAVGQIMGYHKKPYIFKGRTMHWNDMTEPNSDNMFSNIKDRNAMGVADIQYLLAKLGDSDLLNMDYGCDNSGASNNNALNTFRNLGYTADIEGYNSSKIISEIKNNRPVYISGCAFKETYTTGWWIFKKTKHRYSSCHAWLLDGYVKRTRNVTVTTYDECLDTEFTHTYNTSIELIHNNFGGGEYDLTGNYNSYTGWYNKNIFDAKSGPKDQSAAYKSGTENNYQYENTIITNIK